MRTKSVTQMYLDFILPSSPTKVVASYRAKYGALNDLLLANPAVLDLVHADFAAGYRHPIRVERAVTLLMKFCGPWW